MRVIRLISVLSLLAASLWVSSAQAAEDKSAQELVVLTWASYMDPELISEFEEAFDVKVREAYFENDNERDRLLLESSGKGYDLAVLDGITIGVYQKRGWLTKVDEDQIPNLRHIHERWRSAHNQASDYAVPYFWGTTGIAYRTDLIDTEISSWAHLFKPPEAAKGRIAMVGDPRDLTAPALMALGYSPNSGEASELDAAQALLIEQKPNVYSYTYVSLEEDSSLVTGEVAMAYMYSGDALALQEFDEKIAFVVPEEGTILWVDYFTILEASQKKEMAAAFINFMNQPKIAARQAEFVYYPTPNKAAEAYLPTEFLENEVIYPPRAILDRSTFYRPVPDTSLRHYARIYSKITR